MACPRETYFVQPFTKGGRGLEPCLCSQHDSEGEACARAELIAALYDGVAVLAMETFDGSTDRVVLAYGEVPGVTFATAA